MSDIAIRCHNLGKQYRIGQRESYRALRDTINDALTYPARRLRSLFQPQTETAPDSSDFWALRDVNFEVKHGEVVGIIGRNGAGKSTLLKILSRITKPTTGEVQINGRVGSLLEVGTGFHPELTGRENIFLNGAILGMKRAEILRKFDEIVAFAEIEAFLDTPVKRYSSGMYVRLAFAVAAHLETEILVIDEVLAVGDLQFQRKCLGKMNDVSKAGRTVLFVSHNMASVQSLCSRVVWLEEGHTVDDGLTGKVISKYLKHSFSNLAEQIWTDAANAPGNSQVRLHRVCVRPEDGTPNDPITVRTPLVMEFEFWNFMESAHLNVSIVIYTEQGVAAFNSVPLHKVGAHGRVYSSGLVRSICYIPGDLLNDGMYRVQLLIVKDEATLLYSNEEVLVFDVRDAIEQRGGWHGKWIGAVRPQLLWETMLINETLPA